VTFLLHSGPQCQQAVFGSTNEVTNGLAQSDPAGQLAPGTYYWIDIYNGDISYYGNQSDCGGQRLIVTSPIGGPASSGGTAVTLSLSCPVASCRFRVAITAGFQARRGLPLATDARHRGKRNPPVITLARGTVTIRKGSAQQVTLRLTSAGRRFVASHHGRVSATVTIATTINGHTSVLKSRLTLKIANPGKPKPH
jgi:hypothetical protein